MEEKSIVYLGIVDLERNPFAIKKSWCDENNAGKPKGSGKKMQPTAIENFKKVLDKGGRIADIKEPHYEKYAAFQAIRWGYAMKQGDRIVPTPEWSGISKTINGTITHLKEKNLREPIESNLYIKQQTNIVNISLANIDNATLEAIYWWNRDEYYYHKHFAQLDKIFENEFALDFFTTKIFEVFLREYSIRRNLSAGVESIKIFIAELFEYQFFDGVKNGEISIIDEVSNKLKEREKSTNRHTKSLLSKVAFLINPHKFSLYDSLAKESIWAIHKDLKQFKINELDTYSGFFKQSKNLRDFIGVNNLFKNSLLILSEFPETEAFKFFSENNDAFEMRIVDKFLWLHAQPLNRYNNQGYRELIKLKL